MYERYHISSKNAPARAPPVPKFVIIRADNCINCGKCERACIYGVHKRSELDPRKMADPVNSLCKNCFRCIQDCPQRALVMAPGPDYKALGRGVWTSLRISTIWGEAESGKIPVLGAGYRGMFTGPGYDGMWTDMSEIVRPTRDGIHGREFISTSVDIGRKPAHLEFGAGGELRTDIPPIVELPVPFVMDISRLRSLSESMVAGFAGAARQLNTLMIAPYGSLKEDVLGEHIGHIVPSLSEEVDLRTAMIPMGTRVVEIEFTSSWKQDLKVLKSRYPHVIVGLRVNAAKDVEQRVLDMVKADVEFAHLVYDEEAMELDGPEARHERDSLRAVHRAMVSKAVRDQITVIAGGGIAAAEHVPKTIICGADVVALEKALIISLECRDCRTCSKGSCPVGLHSAPHDWVEARVMNMVGAWRDQLLEVLGAMGLREVRRLRGEVGRAIFYEDVEREAFAGMNGGEANG